MAKGGTKGKPPQGFTLTDFQVIEVPRAEAPEGRCPDPENLCYKLVVHYTGSLHYLAFRVSHVYDEYFDPTLEETRLAIGATLPGATDDIVPTTPGEVVGYWQGQWQPRYEQPAEPFVDFAPVGYSDTFTFGYDFVDHLGGHMRANVLSSYPQALAYFRGQPPRGYSYALIDDVDLVTIGKGKKAVQRLQ